MEFAVGQIVKVLPGWGWVEVDKVRTCTEGTRGTVSEIEDATTVVVNLAGYGPISMQDYEIWPVSGLELLAEQA